MLGLHGWCAQEATLCTDNIELSLYSENLRNTLAAQGELNEGQALRVIEQAAQGFLEIFQVSPKVPAIQDNMIFLDDLRVKVWHHPNPASLTPYLETFSH